MKDRYNHYDFTAQTAVNRADQAPRKNRRWSMTGLQRLTPQERLAKMSSREGSRGISDAIRTAVIYDAKKEKKELRRREVALRKLEERQQKKGGGIYGS